MISELTRFANIYLQAYQKSNNGNHLYIRDDVPCSYGYFPLSYISGANVSNLTLGEKYQTVRYTRTFTTYSIFDIYDITRQPNFYAIDVPEQRVEEREALSVVQILEIFESLIKRQEMSDEAPLRALQHLQARVQAKYYSGITGNIRIIFQKTCGCCDVKENEINQRIEKIKQSLYNSSSETR